MKAQTDWFAPAVGKLTFDAEGQEGGPYHSRKFHWPGPGSGVTIGRGFDCKLRTKPEITESLTRAWSPHGDCYDAKAIVTIQEASWIEGLGCEKAFIAKHKDFEITPEQQFWLFAESWREASASVMKISKKPHTEKMYGKLPDLIDPVCLELVVDLRYRGDYTPTTRLWIQRAFIEGNRDTLLHQMVDRSLWMRVPSDRFKRRVEFLKRAICQGGKTE
jgi:hypothetical protein